jgi:dihydrofolate synthase/folylpolyglutamate synthase
MSKYAQKLKQLYEINLGHPVKFGLHNSLSLYKHLGNPLADTPIIHVTGTNGKGSVVMKIAECLQKLDIKTGLFISPHISSFRERIQINGAKICEDDFVVSNCYILQISP